MPRPKPEVPLVKCTFRITKQMLAQLQYDATEQGIPLASYVRTLLSGSITHYQEREQCSELIEKDSIKALLEPFV
ncbi:MAG: hypothetical protein V7K35_12400 [Nostoc sp.]|uniref:hypothetical protein n=1 Tax=Nostoc sp. TaxID=1180 RepID=UPI002FF51D5F